MIRGCFERCDHGLEGRQAEAGLTEVCFHMQVGPLHVGVRLEFGGDIFRRRRGGCEEQEAKRLEAEAASGNARESEHRRHREGSAGAMSVGGVPGRLMGRKLVLPSALRMPPP